MERIALEPKLLERLRVIEGTAELTDENGQVIGEFRRTFDYEQLVAKLNLATDEELDRIDREEPTFTAEQVMERLRKLTKCS